jgi:hypothetical protein
MPELVPAPLLDPDAPELPKTALPPPLEEPEEGDVPWSELPQAERPDETARPEVARKTRRRECICLLRCGMSASRPYGSTHRQ